MNSTKKNPNPVLTCNIAAIYSRLVRLVSGGACRHLFYFHRECGDSNESQLGPPDLKTAARPRRWSGGPPAKSRRHLGVPLPAHRKGETDAGSIALECECGDLGRRRPPAHRVPEAEGRNLITAFFCLWGAASAEGRDPLGESYQPRRRSRAL